MTPAPLDPLEWRERLLREIGLLPAVVETPLSEAVGAVLGGEVTSGEEVPAAPIAAMDGFAVRRADLAVGTTVLPVSGDLPAQPGEVRPHRPGTAARIMTGALVPPGADAVVEVEATDADPYGPPPATVALTLAQIPPRHRHLRLPGEELAHGEVLAAPGDRVGGGLVGLAATLGLRTLPVLRPLQLSVVVTGDELASGDTVISGAVRESNGAMLAAALRAEGVEARCFRSGDGPAQLRAVLETAADGADLVLTTGGIGRGAYDVVKLLLGQRGSGTSEFVHLGLRPGGPQGAGVLPGGTPVVHLPGTPVGALVGYHLFVRPLLPGTGGALRRVRWEEPAAPDGGVGGGGGAPPPPHGGVGPRRGAPGTVHALAARLGIDAQGYEVATALPGRRLAPYGRAEAIALLRNAPVDPAAESAPERSALVLTL